MNHQSSSVQLPRPTGVLSGAYYDARLREQRLAPVDRRDRIGFLEIDMLDRLERVGALSHTAQKDLDALAKLLSEAAKAQPTELDAKEIGDIYSRCLDAVFPTSQALLRWLHQFHGIAREHNLSSVSLAQLRQLEEASINDSNLEGLLRELRATLGRVKSLDDSQGFRQAFEVYGEALVYSLLTAKFKTTRLVAGSTSLPDFACELSNGKAFYVELKSFDIVDGPQRADQMSEDSMRQHIDTEEQIRRGAAVAVGTSEIAPYKRAFFKPGAYDPASLAAVINILIDKTRSAFKTSQFAQGPTFAFALCDRLLIPGGNSSVAPHYYETQGGAVVSGVLWNSCFGAAGWPISRLPDFEGRPGIEGYMSKHGLFSDPAIVFPTGAMIFAETHGQGHKLLGLYDSTWEPSSSWTSDDTEEVMGTLCTAFNNRENSFGQLHAQT